MSDPCRQSPPDGSPDSPRGFHRIAAVVAAAAFAALLTVLAVGSAGAETVSAADLDADLAAQPVERVMRRANILAFQETPDDDVDKNLDKSSADDSEIKDIFERLEVCLKTEGADLDLSVDGEGNVWNFGIKGHLGDELDAAFEVCEPILDELEDLVGAHEFFAFDVEHEAVVEDFDDCLADAGAAIEGLFDGNDEDWTLDLKDNEDGWSIAIDADLENVFDECDEILEEFSDKPGGFWFDGLRNFSIDLDLDLKGDGES